MGAFTALLPHLGWAVPQPRAGDKPSRSSHAWSMAVILLKEDCKASPADPAELGGRCWRRFRAGDVPQSPQQCSKRIFLLISHIGILGQECSLPLLLLLGHLLGLHHYPGLLLHHAGNGLDLICQQRSDSVSPATDKATKLLVSLSACSLCPAGEMHPPRGRHLTQKYP